MKIGMIGLGNMGSAIYQKVSKNPAVTEFFLYEKDPSKTAALGVQNTPLNQNLDLDYIILAVKPKDIESLKEMSWKGTLISIAAGIPLSKLENWFPERLLVRLMPNTPLLAGEGISGVFLSPRLTDPEKFRCLTFLESFTQIVSLEKEELMNAVTALSGSGPAFVYLFIEALSDAGVRAGLSRPDALKLAAQTVAGSARMVLSSGLHPGQLKDQVTSPAGTTIEGLAALERSGFRNAAMEAVQAAFLRSKEMS